DGGEVGRRGRHYGRAGVLVVAADLELAGAPGHQVPLDPPQLGLVHHRVSRRCRGVGRLWGGHRVTAARICLRSSMAAWWPHALYTPVTLRTTSSTPASR